MASAVSVLARELAAALDAQGVLVRTLAALSPVLSISEATLHLTGGGDHHAAPPGSAGPAAGPPLHLPLSGRDRDLGELVVHPGIAPFDEADRALLEIAAVHAAAALERQVLFAEVMELERLKSDFIARVSHELRTPITIITGFLDTLLAHHDSLDPDQRRHMLERSRGAASRLGGLIEELLILSRLEVGMLTPARNAVELAELLDEVRAAAVEPAQVVLDVPDGAVIHSDRDLLLRSLGLVVDNALKYGSAAEVTVSERPDGCVIEVRDRGPGFDDDIRLSAFEMFTRGRSTTTVPGLGVGLAITRTLVEILGGSIVIADPLAGGGGLVRLQLPGG